MHRQQSVRKRWSTALNREVTATSVGHKVLDIRLFKRGVVLLDTFERHADRNVDVSIEPLGVPSNRLHSLITDANLKRGIRPTC